MMNHRLSFNSCLVMLGMMTGSPFVEAQVSIKERVGITPNAAHSTSARTPFSTYYLPCGPLPPSGQGITRYALFSGPEGDRTAVGIGGIGGFQPPTDYHVEITGGGQYIHLKQYPEGTIGTSFDYTWGFGRDVVILCDGQVPADSAIATVFWRAINWPGNEGTIEIFVVRPMYALTFNIPFPQVNFGSNTSVSVFIQNQCDTGPPQATESVSYTVSIISGSRFGVLVNTATNDTGVTLAGLHRNGGRGWLLKFVANRDNPDSLTDCLIRAWASDTSFTSGQDTVLVNPGPAGPFVKFRVTFERDTLLHGDTVKVTAVAADSNNHQVVIPDTTHLTFVIDSVRYGSFINAVGDSLPSPLNGVLYGDARQGRTRFVADGINPPAPGPKGVSIVLTGSNKNGTGQVQIRRVNISVQTARSTLRPLRNDDNRPNPDCYPGSPDKRPRIIDFSRVDTTRLTLTATDGQGIVLTNFPIDLKVVSRSLSGGHSHVSNRPVGRVVTPNGDTLSHAMVKTSSDGTLRLTYLCTGFSGRDSITIRGQDAQDTANRGIDIGITGLQLLSAGSHYTLIGSTVEHPVNHYGTTTTMTRLAQLADSAFADSGWTLQYNDISLVNGGPFDCDTSHQWNTPHEHHRQGTNVDLALTTPAPNPKRLNYDWLRGFFEDRRWGTIGLHNNNHYHISFP